MCGENLTRYLVAKFKLYGIFASFFFTEYMKMLQWRLMLVPDQLCEGISATSTQSGRGGFRCHHRMGLSNLHLIGTIYCLYLASSRFGDPVSFNCAP